MVAAPSVVCQRDRVDDVEERQAIRWIANPRLDGAHTGIPEAVTPPAIVRAVIPGEEHRREHVVV